MSEILIERRNPTLKNKSKIYKLVEDSYIGGDQYRKGDYLYKYVRESTESWKVRKERSVYFNEVAPLADMLVGFLFANPPQREETTGLEYLIKNASKGKTLNEFMRSVTTWSLLYTVGVLVDSPEFDETEISTEKERRDNELNPFCVLYKPSRIRDFSVDSAGAFNWVLLDNSYIDNDNPFVEAKEVKVYRLWTKEYFQDYTVIEKKNGKDSISASEEIAHPIKDVPFKLVSWRDDDSDMMGESYFEDICLLAQQIYNCLSYMDEMLASGTFKVLMYPSGNGKIPAKMTEGGTGPLSIISYDGNLGKEPKYAGAELGDITPFIEAMEFYLIELLKKVGMDTDKAKEFVQSGKAKKIDFEKVKSLLVSGKQVMENTEKWILSTAKKWEGGQFDGNVIYNKDFLSEDIDEKINRYMQMRLMPYDKLHKALDKLITTTVLSGDIKETEMTEILEEIESSVEEPEIPDVNSEVKSAKEEGKTNEEITANV